MKKILFVSWRYPLPEMDGGRIRTMHFVRFLQKYGPIDFIHNNEFPDKKREEQLFSNTYHLIKNKYPETFFKRFFMLAKRIPYPIQEYDAAIFRKLLRLIEANNYDYIIVRQIHSTSGLFNLPRKYKSKVIADVDDIISGPLYNSFFDYKRGMHSRVLRSLNRKLLMNYEKRCLDFGAVTFCRDLDKKNMGQTNNENIFIVPNIYSNKLFEEYDFDNGYTNENTLLFVGTLQYLPNIEGLRWFIKTIFGKFKEVFHDGKLLVVGRSPDEAIKALCKKTDGVELHADAADIRDYYRRCRAVVVPLLTGGGTRIKILEAAIANRPVLSTPMGSEGLDLIDGRDLLLFETPDDFYNNYNALLNKNKYESIINSAKRIVQEKYSRDAFEESMKNVIEYVDDLTNQRLMNS